ncbi:MAG TPA: right-handed parallel beta-helix repeat-containing protein [Steroidobacteraceae bacterium]|nr:right-handed parallel beta-helix repeat-containing protein [Steroidobacteraceae bacterium]
MSNKQRIAIAVGVFLLLGALGFLGLSYESRRTAPGQTAGALTVEVTSPADSGPGTLREALFIADGAKGKANVVLKTRTITLQTALPPLVNSHGVRIVAEQPGAEIDAKALTAGPVFDLTADNTSIEGVVLRNCAATGILLRARHLHLQSSAVESCDVGVDVAENASDILLEHNRFANDRVGVRFTASNPNTVVIGNTFLQDKDAGLWAVRGSADSRGGTISVRENHFTADGSGVVAGNVAVLVERNDFANARDAAIHLLGAGGVIRGNRIQGGTAMGIVAENAGEAVIDSNELEQFATYAIMVRGSANALVRANRIHNCGSGLAFVLGDPRRPSSAVGNTIIEPKFNGIDVLGDSPILRHNQVLRPHAFALHVLDYQQPDGQTAAARPFLEGNNFRADALQTAEDLQMPDSQMRAAARRE